MKYPDYENEAAYSSQRYKKIITLLSDVSYLKDI